MHLNDLSLKSLHPTPNLNKYVAAYSMPVVCQLTTGGFAEQDLKPKGPSARLYHISSFCSHSLEHRFSNAKNYLLGYSANEISPFENSRNPRIGLDSES